MNLMRPFLAVIGTALVTASPALASGFLLADQDPAGTGRGFARTAGVDDAAALYWNPAAMSTLDKTAMKISMHYIGTQTDYDPFPGEGFDANMKDGHFAIPATYVALDVSEHVDIGLAVMSPFALSTQWSHGWAGRYQALDSEVNFIFIQPTISFAIPGGIYLGAGPQLNFSEESIGGVKLSQSLDFRFLGQPDGEFEVTGDSEHLNVGYVVSVLIRPEALDERISIGVTWRATPDDHEISGKARFEAPDQAGLPHRAGAETEVTLPPYLTVGVEFEVVEDVFWMELGYRWVGWSTLDELQFDFDDPRAPSDSGLEFGWENTNQFMLGLEFHVPGSPVVLRAGYQYDETPVTDRFLSPRLPDANRHGVSVGFGLHFDSFRLDIGYMHLFLPEATKRNTLGADSPGGPATANGRYETLIDVLGVSAELRF